MKDFNEIKDLHENLNPFFFRRMTRFLPFHKTLSGKKLFDDPGTFGILKLSDHLWKAVSLNFIEYFSLTPKPQIFLTGAGSGNLLDDDLFRIDGGDRGAPMLVP